MPAIELLLKALGAKAETETAAPKKTAVTGDEFERVMTDALAPSGKKLPGKAGVAENTKVSPKLSLNPQNVTAAPAQDLLATEKKEESTAEITGKKPVATPSQKNSDDLNPAPAALFPLMAPVLPPPDFPPVPLSGSSAPAAKSAPVTDNKTTVANVASAKAGVETSVESKIISPRPEPMISKAAMQTAPLANTPLVGDQTKTSETEITSTLAEAGSPIISQTNFPTPKLVQEKGLSGATKNIATVAADKTVVENSPPTLAADATEPVFQRTGPTLEKVAPDAADHSAPVADAKTVAQEALAILAGGTAKVVLSAPMSSPKIVATDATEKVLPAPSDLLATPRIAPEKNLAPISMPLVAAAPVVSQPVFFSRSEVEVVLPPNVASAVTEFSPLVSTSSQALLNVPEKIPAANLVLPTVNEVTNLSPKTVSTEPVAGRGKINSERPTVSSVAANSGTGVASTLPVMKNNDNVDFLAGSAGQKLPGAGPARSADNAWPVFLKDSPQMVAEKYATDFSAPVTGADNFSASPATATTTVNVLAEPSLSGTRQEVVERTHELVASHALRLVESKADSMSVVLKPEAGTELSLQLRHKDGVVEASAVLAQGDHQLLNAHWADLQAQLELRGVKLGPLGGEGNSSAGQGGQQRPPTREEAADQAAAFAEFAVVAGSAGGAGARLAPDDARLGIVGLKFFNHQLIKNYGDSFISEFFNGRERDAGQCERC